MYRLFVQNWIFEGVMVEGGWLGIERDTHLYG